MAAILAPEIETDEEMQRLYNWVDDVPLSRPKRNIGRDFSDGVLLAEVLHHYFPSRVEMHNYCAANSVEKKEYNFKTLNQKVLKRLGFQLHDDDVKDITRCTPGVVEKVLSLIRTHIEHKLKQDSARLQICDRSGNREEQDSDYAAHPDQEQRQVGGGILQNSNRVLPQHKNPMKLESDRGHVHEPPVDHERVISDMGTTIKIMTEKIKKLEQLLRIKDAKIEALTLKVEQHEQRYEK